METYPTEATRAELSDKLGLTDRQLQMWFCHRRLKDKKEAAGGSAVKPRVGHADGIGGKRSFMESPRDEEMAEPGSDHGSGSGSGSRSSQFDNGDDMPTGPLKYYEPPRVVKQHQIIACIEVQLGHPLREDGPVLGVEFDELPPGAFGASIGTFKLLIWWIWGIYTYGLWFVIVQFLVGVSFLEILADSIYAAC